MQNQIKYYFGSYEKTIKADTITEYCRLPGGAVYKTTNLPSSEGQGSVSTELLFTYTDHLGSITHITDDGGNLLAEQSFDAWDRMRNPETWQYKSESAAQSRTLTTSLLNSNGYTAHEMLPTFALINMNGRLYDPVLGRMLSPDNYIQAPDYTQNFNRYSYILNNPLKYTDPDGEEWIGAVIGAVVGMYFGGVAANNGELNPLQWDWKSGKTYVGIVVGGAIGVVLGALGQYYAIHGGINLAFGIITPLGTVGMVGQGSDWSFQWTTNAGGGGSVPIGDNKQQNTDALVQQQINNMNAEYRKDKQYEYYMYLHSQYGNTSNSTSEYSVQFVSLNTSMNNGNVVYHYMFGGGEDYKLSEEAFNSLVISMYNENSLHPENVHYSGYSDIYVLEFSAYGSDYENTVGYGAFYIQRGKGIVGYSDQWNFERQNGTRPDRGEFKTWIGSHIPGTPFWVLYGVYPPVQYRPTH